MNQNKLNTNVTLRKKARKRRRRRRVRLIAKRRRRAVRRRLPIATTLSIPKYFRTMKTNGTSVTVSGCDLIYSIPNSTQAQNQSTNVISMIPANPAYWTGTRIAALAASYQNYRPLNLEFIYVPMCATTQQGNVIAGTFWNEVPNSENLQQSLKTSNGGIITQAFKPANSIVKLKSNLQFNLYRMGGAIDQQSNPFMFIALAVACTNGNTQIVPGYFYVKYRYILKNPLGTGITYGNSQITTGQAKGAYYSNAVCYLLAEVTLENQTKLPIGTMLDVEYNDDEEAPGYEYSYNDTSVDIPNTTPIWVLENQPRQVAAQRITQKIIQPRIIYWQFKIPSGQSTTLAMNNTAITKAPNQNYYIIYHNYNLQNLPISTQGGREAWLTSRNEQDFGEFQIMDVGYVMFKADTPPYQLEIDPDEQRIKEMEKSEMVQQIKGIEQNNTLTKSLEGEE